MHRNALRCDATQMRDLDDLYAKRGSGFGVDEIFRIRLDWRENLVVRLLFVVGKIISI